MQIKERLRLWGIATSWGWWKVVSGIFFVAGIYDLVRGESSLQLPTLQHFISWWDWKVWLLIAFVILFIGIWEGSYRLIKKIKVESEAKISVEIKTQRKEWRQRYSDRAEIPILLFKMYERSKNICGENKKPLTKEYWESVARSYLEAGIAPEKVPELDEMANMKEITQMFDSMPDQFGVKLPSAMAKFQKLLLDIQGSMSLHGMGALTLTKDDEDYKKYHSQVQLLRKTVCPAK